MMLEIRDVKKSFDGQTVLDGISLDVEKGDVVAFAGSVIIVTPDSLCLVSLPPVPAILSRSRMRSSPFTPWSKNTARVLDETFKSASPISCFIGSSSSTSFKTMTSPMLSKELGRMSLISSGRSLR